MVVGLYWLVLVDVLGRCCTRASGDERHVVRRQDVSEEERVYIIVAFMERRGFSLWDRGTTECTMSSAGG